MTVADFIDDELATSLLLDSTDVFTLELFLLLEILLELDSLLDELFLLLLETISLELLFKLDNFLLLNAIFELLLLTALDELLILELFTGRLPPRWLLTVADFIDDELATSLLLDSTDDFLLDEFLMLELFLLLLEITLLELLFKLDDFLLLDELFELLLEILLELDFLLDELLILELFTGRLPPRWLLTVADFIDDELATSLLLDSTDDFLLDELFTLELFALLLEFDSWLDEFLILELFSLLEISLELLFKLDNFLLLDAIFELLLLTALDELLILEFFTGRLPPRWLLTVATDELFALLLEFDSWLDEFLILELFSLLEILLELDF